MEDFGYIYFIILRIVEIFTNGESITDTRRIREVLKAGIIVTIIATDFNGQSNLLTSSDYRGETFLLGNSTIIIK